MHANRSCIASRFEAMVSQVYITVACKTHENNSGQLFAPYDYMRDQTGFIQSGCWAAAGQHLQKVLLAVGGGWAGGAASCDGDCLLPALLGRWASWASPWGKAPP